jgi:hypothetical protein
MLDKNVNKDLIEPVQHLTYFNNKFKKLETAKIKVTPKKAKVIYQCK